MSLDKDKLLELQAKIEETKTNISRLGGKKEQLQSQLKKDWGCETVDDAEKKLAKFQGKITEYSTQITESTAKLEEEYDFD